MKHIYIVGIFLLISCGVKETESVNYEQTMSEETEEFTEVDSTVSKLEVQEDKPVPETKETSPITFDLGSESLFTDTCAFYFECDCCSGNLILNPDLSFYELNYCESDMSLIHGSYEFLNDTLTLNFDGTCVRREYNWANEMDTSAVDYFITDTLLNSFTHRYATTNCGEKMKLKKIDGDEIGIESGKDYQDFMKTLEDDGLLARLTYIMKKLQPTSRSSQPGD